ncbi:MAG TPA: hypothetical protein VGJ06_15815 [Candidatus Acidoferrum sp.]|jgi:hypothetical protein
MPKRLTNWLTAQQTAGVMNTTSAEVCRLLSLGRLSGSKEKQPGRPGNGQWLIDPKSVAKEKRRLATRTAIIRKPKPALRNPRKAKRS